MAVSNSTQEFCQAGHIPTECALDAMIAVEKIRRGVSAPNDESLRVLLEKLEGLGLNDAKEFLKDDGRQKNTHGFFRELFNVNASLETAGATNNELFSLVHEEYENLRLVETGMKESDFMRAQDFCVKLCSLLNTAHALARCRRNFYDSLN